MKSKVDFNDDAFFLLAEHSPDAIFIGVDGVFKYLNPAAASLFGAETPEQLLDQQIMERVHPDYRADVAKRVERLDKEGICSEVRVRKYLRMDGEAVDVESTAIPFRFQQEQGGIVFARDVTPRNRALEALRLERKFLRQIIDASPGPIFVKDRQGRFLLVNEALARAYNAQVEEIQGRTDADFNPNLDEVESFRRDDIEVMDSGLTRRIPEEPLTFSDGQQHWFTTSKIPLPDADGTCNKVLGVATDITDRRQNEEEIRNLNRSLERRVAERTADLDRKQRDLLEAMALNENILTTSAVGIATYGSGGECVKINPAYAHMVGGSQEALLDQNFRSISSWQDSGLIDYAEATLASGRSHECEIEMTTTFGRDVILHCQFSRFESRGEPHLLVMINDITDEKRRKDLLEESERNFRTLAENLPDHIVRFDLQGRVIYINPALERLLGRPAEALLGEPPDRELLPVVADKMRVSVRQVVETGECREFETPVPGPDGELQYHRIRLVPEFGVDGAPASVLAIGHDLTEQKRDEEELRLAASVFHNSQEGVMITDADGTIESVNPAFTEITGYSEQEAIGRRPSLLKSDRHDSTFYEVMWHALREKGSWQGEIWNRRKGGAAYLEWLTINRIDDSAGNPVRYVSVFHDITELRRKDQRIEHLAFHDALTGLPNRVLIQDRIQHAMLRAERENRRLALIFLDLDRFKAVNDGLGHDIGDLLLQKVAARIRQRVRAMDTVARLGGDEFVILMEDVQETGDSAVLASALIEEVARPMDLQGHPTEIGTSMGIAFFPDDGTDAMELMKRADMAMYAAKSAGRNTYRFFQEEMLEQASRRLSDEMALRQAIAQGELELRYQPKVPLGSAADVCVEALIRWRHPQQGLLGADRFIPLAEENGQIVDIGDWVLDKVCQQLATWRTAGRQVKVAVNISARELARDDLVERILSATMRHGVEPKELEIELTESTMMANPDKSAGMLQQLRQLGVTIALDDFGTGYSSLAYLRRLPIDVLKIDRSFVKDADLHREDAQILKTILDLSRILKLSVVAEGIETEQQAGLLRQLGCDQAQGYFYAQPLPVNDLESWWQQQAGG